MKNNGCKKKHMSVFLALLSVILIGSMLVAGVSAGSITLDVPVNAANTGDTITIPVIMHDAKDIAGFTIDVSNNVSGAVVTINENSNPIASGSYMFNSNEDNDVQRVVWFNSNGFTTDSREIFSLQVKLLSSEIKEVPITITPVTIVNSRSGFLTTEYPVIEVSSFPLTGSTTGKIVYGISIPGTTTTVSSSSSSPVPTATTTTITTTTKTTDGKDSSYTSTTKVTSSPSTIFTSSSNENEQSSAYTTPVQTSVSPTLLPSSESTNPAPTQSSPMGVFPLMALGFIGTLLILKKK